MTYYVLLRQPEDSLATDVFIMPRDRAVTSWLGRYRRRQPAIFAHPARVRRITRVLVRGPQAQPSRLSTLDVRLVRFEEWDRPLLEVELDGGVRGQTWDLRPALPVLLSR
jgi:hypothetical protein